MEFRKSWSNTQCVVESYRNLFADLSAHHPQIAKSFQRDFETLTRRVSAEGISFCTKVLPKLGKAFDTAMDTSLFVVPQGLKRSRVNPAIPAFLQGMLNLVFSISGELLETADPLVVKHIRQVCYLVYKLELPYSAEQEKKVIDSFTANEQELVLFDVPDSDVVCTASELIGRLFIGFDPKDILPRHGPGAVASGERGDKKWSFSTLYDPIHQMYPYYNYFVVGSREVLDRASWYRSLVRSKVGIAKVCLVPKDSRGPRLISMEPLEYQWIQQGLARKMMKWLQRHPFTKGFINFSDQRINQQLARESSSHHAFATLDLKDASDRVSLTLVRKLFPKEMLRALEAVRSHATQLPDGSILPLVKYAPMGSAMCFPVMSVCLWAICVAAVSKKRGMEYARTSVFVYGDDLIVPTIDVDVVVEALLSCGLKLNEQKCFYRGDFRESCGVDAFKGVDVTPTRISTPWDSGSRSELYSSFVAYANDFINGGYNELGNYLWGFLRRAYRNVPVGLVNCSFPCEIVSSATEAISENIQRGFRSRWNPRLQRIEFFVPHCESKAETTSLDSWRRLLRFTNQGVGPKPDLVTLPYRVKMVKRWSSIGFSGETPKFIEKILSSPSGVDE